MILFISSNTLKYTISAVTGGSTLSDFTFVLDHSQSHGFLAVLSMFLEVSNSWIFVMNLTLLSISVCLYPLPTFFLFNSSSFVTLTFVPPALSGSFAPCNCFTCSLTLFFLLILSVSFILHILQMFYSIIHVMLTVVVKVKEHSVIPHCMHECSHVLHTGIDLIYTFCNWCECYSETTTVAFHFRF